MAHVNKQMCRLLQSEIFMKSMKNLSVRSLCTSVSSGTWDLVSSVCLERLPVIARDLSPLEQKVQTLQNSIEFECSLKSDHEVRKEQEKILAEKLKKGDFSDKDLDQATKATAQDFEDASQDEFAKFTFAPRTSSETSKSSLKRHLDSHLMMLMKQEIGGKSQWILPQNRREDGETMRQAAERALATACGKDVKTVFLGNAPWGVYKYKYPRAVRKEGGAQGAKIFFFKALYRGGEVQGKEIQWLTKQEAAECLHEDYFKSVEQFLTHD